MNIYAVIIGSEILDRRREDAHFAYLSSKLQEKGHTLFASFIIKDNAKLITDIYQLVKNDPQAVMFSFGGIGSTPDDLTRQLASEVFGDGKLYRNPTFEKAIIERLAERAYPHPIQMSDLPKDADLLHNPVNNMSGFYLEKKYFFMPGFPVMAQPMMDAIINNFIPQAKKRHTLRLLAECGEGSLVHLMGDIPSEIELSSLPMIGEKNNRVDLSLSGEKQEDVSAYFKRFCSYLDEKKIEYQLL